MLCLSAWLIDLTLFNHRIGNKLSQSSGALDAVKNLNSFIILFTPVSIFFIAFDVRIRSFVRDFAFSAPVLDAKMRKLIRVFAITVLVLIVALFLLIALAVKV